jgi:hypothetical protein
MLISCICDVLSQIKPKILRYLIQQTIFFWILVTILTFKLQTPINEAITTGFLMIVAASLCQWICWLTKDFF